MSETCMYCGKVNGWHLWGCPQLLKIYHFQVFGIEPDTVVRDEVDEAWCPTGTLKTLPEVE